MSEATDKPNVPKLRFIASGGAGHIQPYRERSFDDVFEFSTGKNIKQSEASPEFEVPCVRYGELYHLYSEVIANVINRTNLPREDLYFSRGNEILLPSAGEEAMDIGAASALVLPDVAIGRTINILRPKNAGECSPIYVSYYINAMLRVKIAKLARGSSITNVYNSDLKPLLLNMPTLSEQQKVAEFLLTIDRRLASLASRGASIKAFKRGMTQRLFSQELRFTRNDGSPFPDWEKREFSELAEPSGDRFDPSNTIEVPLVVELEDMETGTGRIRSLSGLKGQVSQKSVFREGDVLFAKLRPYLRKFWRANVDGVCSTEIWVLRPKSVSSNFLYALVQTSKFQQLANQSAGSKMPRADWKVVGGASFTVPHADEAEKIASFLSAIDDKIEAVVKQIEAVQSFKKGLLQQMFV